jgi:PAS domain S-box-containing protein
MNGRVILPVEDSSADEVLTLGALKPNQPLRALIVEDCEDDALLAVRVLQQAGYAVSSERVQTAEAMRAALARQPWDIVLSDHSMPHFSGLEALAILQADGRDLPFVIVSGAIGEDAAVAAMKAGAHDYLIKDRLARLAPVVGRELRDAAERRQRRRDQEALRQSERAKSKLLDRLNEAQALAKIGSWEWDLQTSQVWWSDEIYRMLGVTPQDHVPSFEGNGKFVHPDDLPRYRESFEQSLRSGERLDLGLRMVTSAGELKHCRALGKVFHDASGKPLSFVGTIMDISERKQAEADHDALEAQLRQAQKMEAVGRLAGGVAHDFNNLLMGIMNYAELCRDELPTEHLLRGWLDEILRDTHRSADLTRQLLAFARKQIIAPVALDLNAAVDGMLKLLRRLIGENIELAWQPGLQLWPVLMDPGQIDQILANLCVNARDAIANVGDITIATARVTIGTGQRVDHADLAPGDYVLLTVSDDGCGMGQETLEHLFEPFFTTKEVGKGTGLGLATVYGIIQKNHGAICVKSAPGQGTTFSIYLPRAPGQAADGAAAPAPATLSRGDETILLVEDERSLRVTCRLFLQGLGYTVLVAETPAAALALAAQYRGEIHLLLTDVIMPGMGAKDMVAQLLEVRPQVRCLYMSGYPANVIDDRGIPDQGVHFLAKPFSRVDLVRKVRETLDA